MVDETPVIDPSLALFTFIAGALFGLLVFFCTRLLINVYFLPGLPAVFNDRQILDMLGIVHLGRFPLAPPAVVAVANHGNENNNHANGGGVVHAHQAAGGGGGGGVGDQVVTADNGDEELVSRGPFPGDVGVDRRNEFGEEAWLVAHIARYGPIGGLVARPVAAGTTIATAGTTAASSSVGEASGAAPELPEAAETMEDVDAEVDEE